MTANQPLRSISTGRSGSAALCWIYKAEMELLPRIALCALGSPSGFDGRLLLNTTDAMIVEALAPAD